MSSPSKSYESQDIAATETFLIELGWVIVGRLDDTDQEAVSKARDGLQSYLQRTFPALTWRLPIVQREELARHNREEPVVLLDYGVTEREAKHWDFAFILTDADLISHYKPYALGAPARSVNVAIMSTARLDPQALQTPVSAAERRRTITRRLCALALHLFGHLNGLSHYDEDMHEYMYDLGTVTDLDQMTYFTAAHIESLTATLYEVADPRLEEEPTGKTRLLWFYVRGIWIGRDDIVNAILRANPWAFPFRLSRLTTAAISALLILLMTAEVWDVGMTQSAEVVVGLSLFALMLTSTYILKRQRLLMRRTAGALSEQRVITNISVAVVVLLGMLTTYGLLFIGALSCSVLLFRRQVIVGWAVALDGDIQAINYIVFAAFVASLGLVIGALGASFEQHYYFRHITYIDEET
jgi:predicted Zn-dependent protease